jgi:hypothetical protein
LERRVPYTWGMAVTLARAEEYRRKAQGYFDLARTISLKTDRAVLLDIAQNYLRLAEEAQEAVIQSPPIAEQA